MQAVAQAQAVVQVQVQVRAAVAQVAAARRLHSVATLHPRLRRPIMHPWQRLTRVAMPRLAMRHLATVKGKGR